MVLVQDLSLTPSTIVASRSSLAGRTQDHPLGAGVDVLLKAGPVGESAGRFQGDLAAQLLPGQAAGSFSVVIGISLPLTTMLCSRASTVPLNRPCTLSYFSSRARCFGSDRSLIATTSKSDGAFGQHPKDQPANPSKSIDTNTQMPRLTS